MRSEQEIKGKLKEFEEILKTNPRFYGCLAYEFYAQKDALEWVLGLKELLVRQPSPFFLLSAIMQRVHQVKPKKKIDRSKRQGLNGVMKQCDQNRAEAA